MKKSIALVGFMASGKTTLAQEISKRTGIEFFDTDQMIEKNQNMKINEIFKKYGKDFFTELELNQILKIYNKECIISTGGSSFLNEKIFNLIKENCLSFYLKISPQEAYKRLKKDNSFINRPNICDFFISKKEDEIIDKIDKMIKERDVFYKKADFTILV